MKKLRLAPMIFFLAFIFALTFMFFAFDKKEYSSSEKRYLQQAPAFSFDSLFSGKFGEEFEEYLSDQFAFRNFFVGLNSYYEYAVGNNGSTGIYLCSDGYLVNDPCDADRLEKNVRVIEDFCEKHKDVSSYAVIAPSTGYICSDVLPANHLKYKDDEYFKMFGDVLGSAKLVDVRDTFSREYKNGAQIYYKTDHHWTSLGAYLAYRELSSAMGFEAKDESEYTVETYGGFYGTTYSSSGFWLTPSENIEVWRSGADKKVDIIEGTETTCADDMFFYSHLEEDDKYPVFLDGNHPYTVITNDNADSDESLLIIKDSFAHSLAPFLSDHYASITMIDMRYYKQSVSELIKEKKFDKMLFVYSIDNIATDTDLVWLE